MEKIIDLRSDTVTQPTPAMRKAMAEAEVGDDVYGEDPTINRLEKLGAQKMGKEAGLFVTSGTMGNLIGVLAHCQRGDEALMGHLAHTFLFEAGGISALGSVFAHTLTNQPDGSVLLDDIRAGIRGADIHQPVTRLLVLEDTHNRCGGTVLSREYLAQAGQLVHENGLVFHLDGARIFNAAAALGIEARELAAPANSITFCLSKALCAPVGSVLCGSEAFIARARRIRKMLGGGMRQAGVLAAAGIIAIEEMSGRLAQDHQRARSLAQRIGAIPGMELTYGMPQSNLVFVNLVEDAPLTASEVVGRLGQSGIKVGAVGPMAFRLATHYWIDDEAVDRTVSAFRQVLGA